MQRRCRRGSGGVRVSSDADDRTLALHRPDLLTGKRRRTTYRLTIEEARERYVDPEPVPGSLERREMDEQASGHGQTLLSRL